MITTEEIARVRAEIRERQEARTRQRILGLRAANRTMPVKELAYRAGVSTRYVEEITGEKSPPEGVVG